MSLRKPTQIGFIPEKKAADSPKIEENMNPESKGKELTKKEVVAILKENGIEFDEKAKVEDLRKLIPKE